MGRGQVGAVKHGVAVVATEVRETSVWLKRRGVLLRRTEHRGVWRVTWARVEILSRSVMIRVRIGRRHLPRGPPWVAPVCLCVLLKLRMLPLSSGEIRYTPSPPGGGTAS